MTNSISGMPGGSGDYKYEGDKSEERDAFPTASRRRWRPATDMMTFHLGTHDFDRYEGEDGYDADADEEEEVSQANNGWK